MEHPRAENPWILLLVMAVLIAIAMMASVHFVKPQGEVLPNLFRGF